MYEFNKEHVCSQWYSNNYEQNEWSYAFEVSSRLNLAKSYWKKRQFDMYGF